MPNPFSQIMGEPDPSSDLAPVKPAATKPDGQTMSPVERAFRTTVASDLRRVGDVTREIGSEASEAYHGLKQDITGEGRSKQQQLEDELFSAMPAPMNGRTMRALGHAADFAFAPLTGGLAGSVGADVEHATGVPRRLTGDVMSIFVPLGGPVKGERILEEAAKDAKLGGEAAIRLFRGNPQLQRNVRDMIAAGVKPNLAVAAANRFTRATFARAGGMHFMGAGVRSRAGQTAEAIEESRKGLVSDIAGGRPVKSTTEAGTAVQKGIERFAESAPANEFKGMSDEAVEVLAKSARRTPARQMGFGRKADTLYEHASRLVGNPRAMIPLERTMDVLTEISQRADNPTIRKLIENPVLSQLMKGLAKRSNRATWREARILPGVLRKMMEDPGLRATADDRLMNQLYSALREDLQAGAYRLGGTKAGDAYAEANRYYKFGMDRIDEALTSLTGKTGDQAYFDILRMAQEGPSRDLSRLARIRNSLTPSEWRDISATALAHMGLARPGMATPQTEFSLQTFLLNFNKGSTRVGEKASSGVDSGLKLLFDGAGRSADFKRLEAIANSAGMWQELRKYENFSRSGEQGSFTMELLLGAAAGVTHNIPALVVSALVGHVASEAIMSERFVRWLAKLPDKGGVEEIDKAIEELGKEAKADPSLRSVYHYLGGQIAQAMEGTHRLTEDIGGRPPAEQQAPGSPGAPPPKKGANPFADIMSGKDDKAAQPGGDTAPKADGAQPNMDAEPKPFTPDNQVADYLQYHLGFPVRITSGYRSPEQNARIPGASRTSQHMRGEAWDFVPQGVSIANAARHIIDSGMDFDQLEITPNHLHISFDPQNRHSIVYGGRQLALVNPDHFASGQINDMQDDNDIDWSGIQ